MFETFGSRMASGLLALLCGAVIFKSGVFYERVTSSKKREEEKEKKAA